MQELHNDMEAQLKDATEARTRAEEDSARKQEELGELEGEVARAQTELTMVKAELDGAYGSRAQRAAEVASNPAVQKEVDELNTRNIELTEELAALKGGSADGDLQQRMKTLEKELRETTDEYEAMTKASIEFEKDRERLDGVIDGLRERCEQLETQIAEDRISSMGVSSPTSAGRDGTSETTSTMVLKNEFKRMMKDTRMENMKILKAEQEERKRLETLLRTLRKEHGKPSQTATT
ncbi:Involucrin repeat protein [Aspergillus sp. HF37]|nr:Involucrin repeat protein [Aspergillus sp. HF37]